MKLKPIEMEPTRTFDLLENYKQEFAYKDDAIAAKEQGFWVKYSSTDYVTNSNYVSYGLLALGLKKGERIATISNNRPEWNFMDMGMSQAGMIHVPVYANTGIATSRRLQEVVDTVFIKGDAAVSVIKK